MEKESPLLLIEFLIKHANEPRHIQSIDRSRKNRDPAQRPVRLCAQTNFPLVSDALDSYLDLAPIKMIKVTAAILQRNDRVLIAKRSSNSSLPNKWEFPGGKVEPGETRQGCLKRELWEEFKINATVGNLFAESVFNYDHGCVRLIAYLVHTNDDITVLNAHDEVQWVPADQLLEYDLAPADIPIAEKIIKANLTH